MPTTQHSTTSHTYTTAREQFRNRLTTAPTTQMRCALVTTINGVRYYNDAAANTIDATHTTLTQLGTAIIWILGPYSSLNDYSIFNQLVKNKIACIITFGDADNVIIEFFKTQNHTIVTAANLTEATRYAMLYATSGQQVVFSPATNYYPHYVSLQAMSDEYTNVLTNN